MPLILVRSDLTASSAPVCTCAVIAGEKDEGVAAYLVDELKSDSCTERKDISAYQLEAWHIPDNVKRT